MSKMLKVALIAVARNEDKYIAEWLEYHLSLGFDTIIVADNDDELVLSKFATDRVIIEDYTGVSGVQPKAYSNLFNKYRRKYDWIAFFDIDEFLVIEDDGRDVKTWLDSYPKEVDVVRLNCKHFTDNEELDVIDGNYEVFNRFKTPVSVPDHDRFVKSFIRTSIKLPMPYIYGHGIYNDSLYAVDALGNRCPNDRQKIDRIVHKVAWVHHYRTKTIGEYMRQKYARGGANNNPGRYSDWMSYFFITNKWADEKVEYAKTFIKLLSL
jgi:hypothetical protein